MFKQPLARLWSVSSVATPASTPHTDGVLHVREVMVGLHRGKFVAPRSEAWTVDGDSGLLQDGEGWTPPRLDQSILMFSTIYYRPLASEQLTPPAIEGACLEPSGVKAFKGLLGWRASAEPWLIASGPA